MSNRQRYFTVDEALAQLLQEEDEDFYGGRSEESLDDDGTARGSRLSSAVRSGTSGEHSSDLDENDEEQEHFLTGKSIRKMQRLVTSIESPLPAVLTTMTERNVDVA